MLVLKIPIAALLWLVWWAIHQEPEEVTPRDDGGIKVPGDRMPVHPRKPLPHAPRRGPHGEGDEMIPPPPRVRTVVDGRSREHA